MEQKINTFSDNNNFEAVYKSIFYLERMNVPSPTPSQFYHYHDCYELYYLYSGERYYFIKDKTYHVESGSFVLIRPYEIHCTSNFAQHGYDRLLINFKKEFLEKFLDALGSTAPFECFEKNIHIITLKPKEQLFVEMLLENMTNEYRENGVAENVFLQNSLVQLLLFISKYRGHNPENLFSYKNATHKAISEITGYINNNYHEDITLDSISALFFISPSHFSRTFKRVCGFSFNEYINNVRIKEARKLLAKTNLSIAQVAERTGFKSNAHFDRVFKKITGMAPLAYKKGTNQ